MLRSGSSGSSPAMNLSSVLIGLILLGSGCADAVTTRAASAEPTMSAVKSGTEASSPSAETSSAPAQKNAAGLPATISGPAIGAAAPDFTLKDLDGKEVSLAAFKGKTVVLEWFNPGCPFVKSSHGKGSLKGFSERVMKDGVVWIAINSGAPGKQGHGIDTNREGAKAFGATNPILIDESGATGKAYGATNTPQMVIVDAKGGIVYKGAIDNSPDGGRDSPQPDGAKLVNYVEQALAELKDGKPVSVPETKPYGCGVKYGS